MTNSSHSSAIPRVELKSVVQSNVEEARWKHILGVVSMAEDLSDSYEDLNETDLVTVAYLHDVAKNFPLDRQEDLARDYRGGFDPVENKIPGLWHAPASAQVAVDEFSLDPTSELTRAIAFHPTGQSPMCSLLQGLMVADFCEPARDFSQATRVRDDLGHTPLRTLARRVIKHKLTHCLKNNHLVHPWSIEAYNDLCD